MSEYIKLADGTDINIEPGYTMERIVSIVPTEAEAVALCGKLTPANLARIEFWEQGAEVAYGERINLTHIMPPTRHDTGDGTVTVTISLREKTALELRVDALEESQTTQDGAIEDLGLVVSDLVEG